MVVASIHAIVTLRQRMISAKPFNSNTSSQAPHAQKRLTILQWLDRGGRYVLHVVQYFTRTLDVSSISKNKNKLFRYGNSTHTPARTFRSRGRGCRAISSDSALPRGGSGSRFRGRIPGSRKACETGKYSWQDQCLGNLEESCSALTVAAILEMVRRHI